MPWLAGAETVIGADEPRTRDKHTVGGSSESVSLSGPLLWCGPFAVAASHHHTDLAQLFAALYSGSGKATAPLRSYIRDLLQLCCALTWRLAGPRLLWATDHPAPSQSLGMAQIFLPSHRPFQKPQSQEIPVEWLLQNPVSCNLGFYASDLASTLNQLQYRQLQPLAAGSGRHAAGLCVDSSAPPQTGLQADPWRASGWVWYRVRALTVGHLGRLSLEGVSWVSGCFTCTACAYIYIYKYTHMHM